MSHLTIKEAEAFDAFIQDALTDGITLSQLDLVYLDDMSGFEGGI